MWLTPFDFYRDGSFFLPAPGPGTILAGQIERVNFPQNVSSVEIISHEQPLVETFLFFQKNNLVRWLLFISQHLIV